jgi:carbon storage regulator
MLILTRKLGETINIGENIEVKVLKVRGTQVQLGISAPPEIRVMRQEIIGKEGNRVQS